MSTSVPISASCLLSLAFAACAFAAAPSPSAPSASGAPSAKHNVIIFVADGLRHGAVDTADSAGKPFMPTFAELRKNGVNFINSHSLFPTVTTPNASAIATGHYIGDTGNFSNSLFLGYPSLPSDKWGVTHAIESDYNIPDINEHFSGNYLSEDSLIATARRAGFHTAIIGKYGPALVQDVTLNNYGITAGNISTILVDDATGTGQPSNGERGAVPLPALFSRQLVNDEYFKSTYFKNPPSTDPRTPARTANNTAGTKVPNTIQQKYFIDVLTHAILPSFVDPKWGTASSTPAAANPNAADGKPFVIVYWSRDPDGTQHNQQDGTGITPGINGPTVHAAFQNADSNLQQLVDYLKATPDLNNPGKMLSDTTDIFITSDHGFSTVAKGILDAAGTTFQTFASSQHYSDTRDGQPPRGFIAIDLAHDLNLPLYDGDTNDASSSDDSPIQYKPLRLQSTATQPATHPSNGIALIGGTGTFDKDGYSASLIAIPGLIYIPPQRPRSGSNPSRPEDPKALIQKVVASLSAKPYISGIFVDTDRFGSIPGALSLSDINLRGSARTPFPAVMYSVRSFSTDPANPEMTGVMLADSGEKQGGGSHGTFGRQDTFNCMIAFGPDFKSQFTDPDPVSNADIAITLSHILGMDLTAIAHGHLTGRILTEALANGPAPKGPKPLQKSSAPNPTGISTILHYQLYTDDTGHTFPYFDAAGFPGASVGIPLEPRP
ncbi:MAG TPA: alkaline phosphatase family protein [Phycisphaerae bacterium]